MKYRNAKGASEVLIPVCLFVLMVVFFAGWWVVASHMEARAYNNATGKNVSTLDAMFIELRVQSEARD